LNALQKAWDQVATVSLFDEPRAFSGSVNNPTPRNMVLSMAITFDTTVNELKTVSRLTGQMC